MSKASWAQTDDRATKSALDTDAPEGQVKDDSYVTEGNKDEPVPVQSDDAPVEDPVNPAEADSTKQLEQDEKEAIDKSNIIKERSRGAKPRGGSYEEPSDDKLGLTE